MSAFDTQNQSCPPLQCGGDEPDVAPLRKNRKRSDPARSTMIVDFAGGGTGTVQRIAPVRKIDHHPNTFTLDMEVPMSTRSLESIQSVSSTGSSDPTPKASHFVRLKEDPDPCAVGIRRSTPCGRRSPQWSLWSSPADKESPRGVSPGPELLLSQSIEVDFGVPGIKSMLRLKRQRANTNTTTATSSLPTAWKEAPVTPPKTPPTVEPSSPHTICATITDSRLDSHTARSADSLAKSLVETHTNIPSAPKNTETRQDSPGCSLPLSSRVIAQGPEDAPPGIVEESGLPTHTHHRCHAGLPPPIRTARLTDEMQEAALDGPASDGRRRRGRVMSAASTASGDPTLGPSSCPSLESPLDSSSSHVFFEGMDIGVEGSLASLSTAGGSSEFLGDLGLNGARRPTWTLDA